MATIGAAMWQAQSAGPSPAKEKQTQNVGIRPGNAGRGTPLTPQPGNELIAFGGGCFWGVEDWFRKVPGVVATAVGYTGGHTKNPTYEQVCSDTTGHAEVVLVEYDPKRLDFDRLMVAFWEIHDPTQLNRQGPDFGTQYRSGVWAPSAEQRTRAQKSLEAEQKITDGKIVTVIEPLGDFYIAEDYHQQYNAKTGHSCPPPRKRKASTTG